MPTSCVQQYHCGTNAPVWLNGALPSVAEGEAPRTACINYGHAALGAKCCNRKLNIKVKNCNGFYVYHLSRVPGCSIAYCAGKLFFSSKNLLNLEIYVCGCCWNVATYKSKVNNGKIEVISFVVRSRS